MTVLERESTTLSRGWSTRTIVWFGFSVAALVLLDVLDLAAWTGVVLVVAALLAAVPALRPATRHTVDRTDLLVVALLYVGVVAAFRLAFTGFTTDNVLGLFLSFATGLLLGVVVPVVYQVWGRGRGLESLGIGAHRWRGTVAMGLVLAATQLVVTMVGYALPEPEDWVPLLGMSLVVGLFEAVFFRGFVQGRLEASLGPVPAVAGAAALYAVYHVGYGMGAADMWFLLGLGVLYAVIYRLTTNILIVWPLLTPVGAFFNNLEGGEIDLPWASLMGFADVALVMAGVGWLAHRHERKALAGAT
ncbi:MAG TPA: CPBP family glutamic-type intramembrane protease [Ornithinibacter sp.]|nr:CPBP family glutamic-type intramembrane protease [Ornithinibacter sp.]